ncbi:MAG TPA: glycogen debranching N-terminal domain-containing protein [Allosphingosinicella sp.]|nr:glycogen debranching N-terminal domain-containing protein [Allosphingosinicella sp.]
MNEFAQGKDWPQQEPASAPESYHIEATKSLVDRTLRTLKHDDLFGVFDKQGDCQAAMGAPDGLYYQDTRFLSGLSLRIGGMDPLLLGSVLLDDNGAMVVDLANADFHDAEGKVWLQRDAIHASRVKFLCGTTCYERIRVRGFGPVGRTIPLDLAFAADFADLFEVRGDKRPKRGRLRAEVADARTVRFTYLGLDAVERTTTLQFDPAPDELTEHHARWAMDLDSAERFVLVVTAACALDGGAAEPPHILSAYRKVRRAQRDRVHQRTAVTSANELFNTVIDRAASDIDMLLTETPWGLYPYAGIPWYSTIFGRDGIITAMELLWAAPEIARGVLNTLAATQATGTDEAADAQPGKILHETRGGEMARLKEVPFRLYYGTVDATPLFVMLAGMYLKRSGDLATIRAIWPNVKAALGWMDGPGDPDGDGFVEYARATEKGLQNQGWKDSFDSIFHADGSAAEGPIALCEVQAYVFAAKQAAAEMARALGEPWEDYGRQAETLRQKFEDRFWLDDLGCYALALDGRKQPCRVLSSNAGHALFAGIASPERAARLAGLFTGKRFFSGWGVRTIAAGEARYNPMSYHNGSVWPHDNALIAMGLARYGHRREVLTIFQGLAEAALYDEFRRLPELFCGFSRRRKRGPTNYPVACSPQAWAAAAPFALVAAATGLELDHETGSVRLADPALPDFLSDLVLRDVSVAGARLDLHLSRAGGDVTTAVTRREGKAGLTIVK